MRFHRGKLTEKHFFVFGRNFCKRSQIAVHGTPSAFIAMSYWRIKNANAAKACSIGVM
ncbi:hypothetical protein RBWH47_05951 [Rhodopirellula baltica WH47]|uniref:Uncharacterized protein n=1 Tax=Rhodopirellula baltica WH47 TaxID=991778 RepID=F2AWP4_RHOBT|nr:hypothetical protein RBWH47_05951 [Rhodopirellula baltica WH47]